MTQHYLVYGECFRSEWLPRFQSRSSIWRALETTYLVPLQLDTTLARRLQKDKVVTSSNVLRESPGPALSTNYTRKKVLRYLEELLRTPKRGTSERQICSPKTISREISDSPLSTISVSNQVKGVLGRAHIRKNDLLGLPSDWGRKPHWGCYIDVVTGQEMKNEARFELYVGGSTDPEGLQGEERGVAQRRRHSLP